MNARFSPLHDLILPLVAVFGVSISFAEDPRETDAKVESLQRGAAPAKAVPVAGTPFKALIEVRAGEERIPVAVYFAEHFAVEFDPEDNAQVVAVYDLDRMTWTEFSPPRTVTLNDCEAWARASVQRTEQSLARSTDERLNKFIRLTLDPQFEVAEQDNALLIKNEIFAFSISDPQPVSDQQRAQFFAYDRLNAYRKAIVERKFGPQAQLAVLDELEKRGFVPGSIELQVSTPAGPVKLATTMRVTEMTPDEKKRVAGAIERSKATGK
jgi:hypothetical protein